MARGAGKPCIGKMRKTSHDTPKFDRDPEVSFGGNFVYKDA